MKIIASAWLMVCVSILASGTAMAGNTVSCPDLSQAKQLLECTAEAEVIAMYKKTFGFNCGPEAKKTEKCDGYEKFKRRKFTSLWESSNGEFMSYVNCDLPITDVKMAKASSITVSQKNGLYKISCNYEKGISFTQRTRSTCLIPGVNNSLDVMRKECGPDASNCVVECR